MLKASKCREDKLIKAFVDDLIDLGITNEKATVRATHTLDQQNHYQERLLEYGGGQNDINNKWLANASDASIVFDFKSIEQVIYGIGVKSAGDCVERDPHTMTIYVPDDSAEPSIYPSMIASGVPHAKMNQDSLVDYPAETPGEPSHEAWKEIARYTIDFEGKRWYT